MSHAIEHRASHLGGASYRIIDFLQSGNGANVEVSASFCHSHKC
ncbi:MAG TPA: hypothetical protein GXX77_00675 [Candidatus Cloacimonetes bacterium]|nr:hypothetical protein [Candidatus Cloacimonadota bacterium]